LQNGFVLREMASYQLPTCLRVTIGTDEENEKILNILKGEWL
jgi:histidinol-phosphate/aromatic aminotransferase/cobyric acid decarboxylase-like protein